MNDSTLVDITPDKSLVKKLGMVGYNTEQAISELIDNSIDARLKGIKEEICVELDFKKRQITVSDDGCGMNMTQLADAMVIAKESSKSDGALGKFGIGMKSACSALGKRFVIRTSVADSEVEYQAEYDEDMWLSDDTRSWRNFFIAKKPFVGEENRWHGTRITVSEINIPLYPNQVSKFRKSFGIRYGPYLQNSQIAIRVNTKYCQPADFDVVEGSRIPVDIRLEFGHHITGYLSLLKKHSVSGYYGIHMFKNGRLIEAFKKFGFSQHPNNSKIIGRLDLDHVPVNFSKNAFIEESPKYVQAVKKFESSDALQKALRMSRTVDNDAIVQPEAVFDYFCDDDDDNDNRTPQYIAKRMSARLSKTILDSSEPFKIMIGKKPATVSLESIHGGSLYQISKTDDQFCIIINRSSKAFGFVRNPLFLMALIASEVRLLEKNPNLADIAKSRNVAIESFLDEWSQEKEPATRNRHVPIPDIPGYGIVDNLIGLHEFLNDMYEFKFQFTSLSTLVPYVHNLLGKVVYTLYTTPGNGRYLTDLITSKFNDDIVIANNPNRDQITALLDVQTIKRLVAVREYSTISGSTIASPEKALVDLITDIRTHGIALPNSEMAHILKRMKMRDILNMKRLEGYAAAARRTAALNELLAMIE